MRKNVQAIADAFMSGSARTESRMFTTGDVVYSYDMPIAQRVSGEIEIIARSQGPSMTTKTHIAGLVTAMMYAKQPFKTVQVLTGFQPHTFRRQIGAR